MRDLNRLYREHARACMRATAKPDGFRWIVADDADQSVFAWLRFGAPTIRPWPSSSNFTPVPRRGYRIGLPCAGRWREILNTDAPAYGGSAASGNLGAVQAVAEPAHGFPASARSRLPPLGDRLSCSSPK